MRINQKLNLVVPFITGDDKTIYIHSSPISRDLFEQFYSELGAVFTNCMSGMNEAHLALSAPQLAYPALKSITKKNGTWDGVKFGLVNEIIRLTNVLFAGEKGWESLPLEVAKKQGILDDNEESEVLSDLIFFIAISSVAPKQFRQAFLAAAGSIRNWDFTSSNSMEYMSGLQTSTEKETTLQTVIA